MRWVASILVLCLISAVSLAAGTFPPTSTPTIPGIDVSAWQRTIDWTKVRSAGVQIAMIRASEGDDFKDPYFDQNYAGAKAAGIAVGYYHFLTAQTTAQAVAQADFFIGVIAGKAPDCLLAVDFGGGSALSGAELTACAEAFLARVNEETGYGVMLYTDAWAAKARYGESIARYSIWVANYGVPEPEANGKWSAWVGFQYYDRGRIAGIDGYVDLDHFTREVYQGTGPTPTPTPAPTPIPGSETLYYQAKTDAAISTVASTLGTTEARIRSLNDIVNDTVQNGQIVRYPSEAASTGASFAGLHVLQKMESLGTIARRYGTTVDALVRLNALSARTAPIGQVLRVPVAPGRSGVASPPSWLLENVVVLQAGQTVGTIASLYGIPASTLYTVNGLTAADTVYQGQILHLQAFGRDETPGFSGGYVIRRGDTLVRIAERFGTTAAELYNINNIANRNLIFPGQILLLPDTGEN